MTSYATRTQTSTEQNDLKKLKSKYSSKLTTLKELFADWSDEDLLFALDEADGVLEVAVDRISEGHATQWGEVKTKKAKKEAQQKAKAAAAAAVPSSAQTMSYQKQERSYTERPKPAKARVSSTNNHSRKSTTTTTTTTTTNYNNSTNSSTWGYSSGHKPSSSSILETSGGSWASIASTKPAHDPASDWNTSTTVTDSTTTATINDPWTQASWSTDEKEITETTTSSALLNDTEKPKSWASLLKSQAKPEEQQQTTKEPETNDDNVWNTANDEPVNDAWNTTKDEPVQDGWDAPVEIPSNAWGSTAAAATTAATEPAVESTTVAPEPVEDVDESKKSVRRLTQESPVVMPNNDVAVSSVDVKFGSLNLDENVAQEPIRVEESVIDTKVETQPQASTEPTTELATEQTYTQPAQPTQQSAYAKQQESAYSQPQAQQQQQPQATSSQIQPVQPQAQPQLSQQIPQQQQPQQPFGMDHLTSAYSSYVNQHPTGMSGFGMNPMGNLPDYGVYGTEAQRAAAMGYYDPSTFNNSPSVTNASAYSSRDKFGQDTSASLGTPQGQQSTPSGQTQGLHGQQMYPGMPYYPYYYMPNHYNAYQQSMYGQPMMNKNMYPNMYQQQQQAASVKPTTHSAYGGNSNNGAATAGAAASPYALHSQLYNQPSNVGGGAGSYDDLQSSFGGLHDYQKSSPYGHGQQLHGFLGHPQQQQQQQQGQSVDPSKNDTSSSRVNAASSSQPQQPQQQHQQQQQHPMNYFGQQQQHMFSYQQYPQQQYWNQ